MDKAELNKMTQVLNLNHQKILQIEEQINKLDQVKQEHETATRSINQLINVEENEGMVPIGAGVQIPIDYTKINSAIIDLGSGIHAEHTLEQVVELLIMRAEELQDLIDQLVIEHTNISTSIQEINQELQDLTKTTQEKEEKEEPQSKKKSSKKRRRRYGGELTLDD
jgi:prefoldin alpha subunit